MPGAMQLVVVAVAVVAIAGLLLPAAVTSATAVRARNFTLVDVRTLAPGTAHVAVRAGAGLWNREGANVYVVQDDDDVEWLSLLLAGAAAHNTSVSQFLSDAYARYGAILYDSSLPTASLFLPPIITLAGALDAIPMDLQLLHTYPHTKIVYNTTAEHWDSVESAVVAAAAVGLPRTTSLAFQDGALLAKGLLVDWLVGQRIFTQYLNRSCIPGTTDHNILLGLLNASTWSRPVRVYGYNSADVIFGGDLFEAETNCVNVMGQVATAHSNNLAFWSAVDPFVPGVPQGQPGGPLVQSPSPHIQYDPSKAYVALVYGDMDNIDFVQSFGRQHMQERARRCSPHGANCFPLSWTLSPNLVSFGPAMMRWYYAQVRTKHLTFVTF